MERNAQCSMQEIALDVEPLISYGAKAGEESCGLAGAVFILSIRSALVISYCRSRIGSEAV